jgi:hypothetical protein
MFIYEHSTLIFCQARLLVVKWLLYFFQAVFTVTFEMHNVDPRHSTHIQFAETALLSTSARYTRVTHIDVDVRAICKILCTIIAVLKLRSCEHKNVDVLVDEIQVTSRRSGHPLRSMRMYHALTLTSFIHLLYPPVCAFTTYFGSPGGLSGVNDDGLYSAKVVDFKILSMSQL